MRTIEIEFDFLPPSTNTYYRKYRNIMTISEKGREFKKNIQKICDKLNIEKIQGEVSIRVELYFKDKRNRDIDNYCGKALFDSIKDILIEDDSLIYEMHAYKKIACGYNLTKIKIKEMIENV